MKPLELIVDAAIMKAQIAGANEFAEIFSEAVRRIETQQGDGFGISLTSLRAVVRESARDYELEVRRRFERKQEKR